MWRGNMLWSHLGSTQVIYNNGDDDHDHHYDNHDNFDHHHHDHGNQNYHDMITITNTTSKNRCGHILLHT